MRKIPHYVVKHKPDEVPPQHSDSFNFHITVVESKNSRSALLKSRVKAKDQEIEARFNEYDHAFETNTLELISEDPLMQGMRTDLQSLYNFKSKPFQALHELLDVVEKNTSPTVKDCSYLIEFDNNYDETWKFKTSMRELPCLFKDDFKVTVNNITYDGSAIFENLKTYINAIESNLTNGYYTEAYKSLDINSVIDYWFVYEIAMNDEIQHPKSVYMYKDGDGKLSAGPVWDFDSQNFTNVDTEKNAYYYHDWNTLLIERAIKYNETPRRYYMWWPLLMKDQNYINRVKARWADVYPDLIDVANRVVEERRAANRLSDEYNRKIWKVGNYLDEHWLCGDENMAFDDVMDNLKYCYNKRLENLNNTITNLRKW